jgi:hypothetical protein
MAILELVREKPDWMGALAVAMARPPGVPERRSGEDPWNPSPGVDRPRRISDDLAWFRQAVDEPTQNGLASLDEANGMAAWESSADTTLFHLDRLSERGVLQAAGFVLHKPDMDDGPAPGRAGAQLSLS